MQTIPVHVFMCLCSDRIKISQEMEFQSLLLAETSAGRYSAAADLVSPCFFFPDISNSQIGQLARITAVLPGSQALPRPRSIKV